MNTVRAYKPTRKSQVTIFVILGIVILIIIGIVLFIVSNLDKDRPEDIPAHIQPVKQYVEECLYNTAKLGLRKLGQQGGYIDLEEVGIYSIPNMPTSSTALELAPDTGLYIPYWYYMASSNTCTNCYFSSKKPALYKETSSLSIESQLNKYIEQNIQNCLDFSVYENKFIISKIGRTSVNTALGEDKIVLNLEYPLNIKYLNSDNKLTKFKSEIDVPLKDMYDVAQEIVNLERAHQVNAFSRMARELISIYSSGKNSPIPPMYGPYDFELKSPRYWIMEDVQEEFQDILTQNMPIVQIEGSRESRIIVNENPFDVGIYSNFLLGVPADYASIEDFNINFAYLDWWPIYLDITPRKGNIVWPESLINTFILPFSITRYDFAWDVSYPILVTIHDPEAFNGEGYTFQFAFEVNLRNNEPLTADVELQETIETQTGLFPEQLKTGEIKVKTKNSLTEQPLEDVMVIYNCVDDSAFIGLTKVFAGDAYIRSSFPTCTGGTVIMQKPGFVDKTVPLDLVEDEELELEYGLDPIVKMNMFVKKKPVRKQSFGLATTWQLMTTAVQDLHPDEEAIIIIERQKESPHDSDFIKYYQLKEGETEKEIEISTGLYKIEAYLIRKFGDGYSMQSFTIPAKKFCFDTKPLNPFSGDRCETIPPITFNNSMYIGGILFDETTGLVEITAEDLPKQTMTLYLVYNALSDFTQIEDLEQLDKVSYYSKTYRSDLLPVFE